MEPPPARPMLAMPPARTGFEKVVRIAGAFVGIAVFAGLVAFHAAVLVPPPPYPGQPIPDPQTIAYRNTVRALALASAVLLDLAVGVSVTLAWLVGASKGEVPDGMRRGLFIFAAVFFVVWLVFSFSTFSSFRYI